MTNSISKAIFPIAGLGTRFLPATKSVPKEMLTILDRPVIEWAVIEAAKSGVKEMIFVISSRKAIVLEHFEKYLYDDDYLKVGHNILGFDIYVHNIYRKLLGLPTDYSYLNRCIDTLCLAKAIYKEIDINDSDDILAWQFKLNSFFERGMKLNLAACCKTYDVDFDPTKLHDALYDIKKNYEVFRKMIWNVKI